MSEKQLTLFKNVRVLTARERVFLDAYTATGNLRRAYKTISPEASDSSADSAGCRYMRRIKAKLDDDEFLDEAGLGKEALFHGLKRMLKATKPAIKDGEITTYYADNAARMQALTLLADLHGMRKRTERVEGEITLRPGVPEEVRELYDELRQARVLAADEPAAG